MRAVVPPPQRNEHCRACHDDCACGGVATSRLQPEALPDQGPGTSRLQPEAWPDQGPGTSRLQPEAWPDPRLRAGPLVAGRWSLDPRLLPRPSKGQLVPGACALLPRPSKGQLAERHLRPLEHRSPGPSPPCCEAGGCTTPRHGEHSCTLTGGERVRPDGMSSGEGVPDGEGGGGGGDVGWPTGQ